jgi:hypothetical protein
MHAGCAPVTGAQLAAPGHPARCKLPANYATLNARLTDHSFTIHATGVDHATATLAQGAAAHDVLNGAQGLVVAGGAAIATSGLGGGAAKAIKP